MISTRRRPIILGLLVINNQGQIVGLAGVGSHSCAVLWQDGVATALAPLLGHVTSAARGPTS